MRTRMRPGARAKLPARGASTPYDSHSTFSCISLFLSNPIAHEVTCWTILWPVSRVVNGAPHKRAVHRRPAITDMSVVHHYCKFNQMQSRICGMRPHPGTSVDFRCLSNHLSDCCHACASNCRWILASPAHLTYGLPAAL